MELSFTCVMNAYKKLRKPTAMYPDLMTAQSALAHQIQTPKTCASLVFTLEVCLYLYYGQKDKGQKTIAYFLQLKIHGIKA